jgi:hypothetical protein
MQSKLKRGAGGPLVPLQYLSDQLTLSQLRLYPPNTTGNLELVWDPKVFQLLASLHIACIVVGHREGGQGI